MRSAARRAVIGVVTLTLLGIGPVTGGIPSEAVPHYPGADDVARAKKAVSKKSKEIGRIRSRLAAASARAETAHVELSVAVEDFDEAREVLAQRTREAGIARRNADLARGSLAGARREVGLLAAAQYRTGGVSQSLQVLLSVGDPQDVLDSAGLLATLGDQRRQVMERMDATRVVADVLDRQARRALAEQQAAAARLDAARREAERRAAAAEEVVRDVEKTKDGLLRQLATLERTSVRLQRERQEGLEAERQAREEARRRAEAQRRDREAREREARDRERESRQDRDPPRGGGSRSSSGGGQLAVSWATQQIGKPYLWGAEGPNSYDCSGLTMRAWQQAGVYLAHSSRIQYQQVPRVPAHQMRVGDLLFWATNTGNPATIHHVALYAGDGMMVEAPRAGANVRRTAVRWTGLMAYVGRP
jgi:cell wall-associated NlpC family hydrolase